MTGDTERLLSRPNTNKGRLQRACLNLIREHVADDALPTDGRFVYYELEQCRPDLVDKTKARGHDGVKRGIDQYVSDALMRLRQVGLVPWEWILDERRELVEWPYAPSVGDYALDAVATARIDLWAGAPPPLIICESAAAKGVLRRIAARYLAPITATSGQAGGFLVTDVAPVLAGNDRPVLYVGDHELRGPADQIEANTRRYLERHADREFTAETWVRVALTAEQVQADPRLLNLVMTKKDTRYKPAREYDAVECEAIGQQALTRLVRDHLDALLPEPLAHVLVREAEQRQHVALALADLIGMEDQP